MAWISEFLFNMILVIGAISLFNLARTLIKVRKIMKMHKDNPNIQGISIINGEVKVLEKEDIVAPVQPVKEMVIDSVCQKKVEKEHAYRIVKDGVEHFFCSWECLESFKRNHTCEEDCK